MNEELQEIPNRILRSAICALSQANTQAVYSDPGVEYRQFMSVLSAAHAGELFLKAIIAHEHPLLIFKDLFSLDDGVVDEIDMATLLKRGKTHDFEKLPQVLWASTGIRIPNPKCYERIRRARNNVQHFLPSETDHLPYIALEFIYTIIDPLICEHFEIYAIEHHEDFGVGYDYIVSQLIQSELCFSFPKDFTVTEIDLGEDLSEASPKYREWFQGELLRLGKSDLLSR